MISCDHPRRDVDRQRYPRPADCFALETIHEDDIGRCVVDLHDLERKFRTIGPRYSSELLPRGFGPGSRPQDFARIHRIKPSLDSSTGGWRQSSDLTSNSNFRDHACQACPFALQIIQPKMFFDKCFDRCIYLRHSFRSTALSGRKGTRTTLAIQKFPKQSPDSGRTNTQLPSSIFNSSRLRAFSLRDRGLQTAQDCGAARPFRAFDLTEVRLWVCEGLHQENTHPPYARINDKTLMLRVKLAQ